MSKFNDLISDLMKPLIEAMDEEQKEIYFQDLKNAFQLVTKQLKQNEEYFKNIELKVIGSDDPDLKISFKGVEVTFDYEGKYLKVPLSIFGYVGEFPTTEVTTDENGDEVEIEVVHPISVGYNINDPSITSTAETRHVALKYLPGWLSKPLTSRHARDKVFNKTVNRPFVRVWKSSVTDPEFAKLSPEEQEARQQEKLVGLEYGPTTFAKFENNLDVIVNHLVDNLNATEGAVQNMVDEYEIKDPTSKENEKDIETMSDEELDALATSSGVDVDTPDKDDEEWKKLVKKTMKSTKNDYLGK